MDLVERLHERLVAALSGSSDTPADLTITVGDLYQRLIPYRVMRTELGVMELAAYEHALLRLLAGEGGYVEASSAHALGEIGRELASVNPILGIYRDFADVPVRVDRVHMADREPSPPPVSEPDATSSTPAAEPPAPPPADQPVPSHLPDREVVRRSEPCASCGESLPALSGLRFCPYCGATPPPKPCVRCATPLESDWNFCIRCGTAVGGSAPV